MTMEGCFNLKPDIVNESRLSRFSTFEMYNPSSPEMFESDQENEEAAPQQTNKTVPSPIKLSREELILKSDSLHHSKIIKYLSGVPPPPKHTACPLNCNEMLTRIHNNRDYFWINYPEKEVPLKSSILQPNENSNDSAYPDNDSDGNDHCNDNFTMTMMHDEQSKDSAFFLENNSTTSDTFTMSSISSNSDFNKSKEIYTNELDERTLMNYNSTHPDSVINMSFEEAYKHKAFGIHYNRNKATEEFERLTVKLCERYISMDTESTCNIWFTSSAATYSLKPPSVNERLKGQSPGKRLNYLTKRRRTFSRANLQNLTAIDKKHRLFNYKKMLMRKGKSPRGKSPRGKSPRGKSPRGKTPRSSTKKRIIRKLNIDDESPHKPKMAFPKRALFQSPPSDKAGPSKIAQTTNINSHMIKRSLFSAFEDDKQISSTENRKRKYDEPLEGPRLKLSKSMSFDCSRTTERKSPIKFERHTSDIKLEEKSTASSAKIEMSSAHRKKLFWAVAEALRAKGIGMGDPRFKQYASCLARTVKKYMPDLENRNVPRKPGSTTDRMLKLAKRHVYLIIEGKLVT